MSNNIRRVVTGHDANGKAIIAIDEIVSDISQPRPGQSGALVFMTQGFPIDNSDVPVDGSAPAAGVVPGRSTFRITTFEPGVAPRAHRTQSFEYGVVLSGEIKMVIEDASVLLKSGDCFVQRGTIHDWINEGSVPCVVAMISMAALPLKIGDKVLAPQG